MRRPASPRWRDGSGASSECCGLRLGVGQLPGGALLDPHREPRRQALREVELRHIGDRVRQPAQDALDLHLSGVFVRGQVAAVHRTLHEHQNVQHVGLHAEAPDAHQRVVDAAAQAAAALTVVGGLGHAHDVAHAQRVALHRRLTPGATRRVAIDGERGQLVGDGLVVVVDREPHGVGVAVVGVGAGDHEVALTVGGRDMYALHGEPAQDVRQVQGCCAHDAPSSVLGMMFAATNMCV